MGKKSVDDDTQVSKDSFYRNAPRDPFYFAYLAFYMQGVSMFLGWNIFFTASEFFSYRFSNSPFSANYSNYFSLSYMLSNMFFVTVATLRQHKANFARQLVLSSIGNLLIFAALVVLALWQDIPSAASFYISLILFGCCGLTCAYMQNSCFAISARWEPKYVQAICSGQGFGGALTALAPLLVSLLAKPESLTSADAINHRAFVIFLFSGGITAISFVSYLTLRKMDIYQYYTRQTQFNEWGFEDQPKRLGFEEMLVVVKKIFPLVFAQVWVWLISLSVFPAVTGNITSVDGPGKLDGVWGQKVIFVGLHYLVYNCGDWTGRIITGLSDKLVIKSKRLIALLTLLRTGFIILFMICNSEEAHSGGRTLPTLISSDVGFFLVLGIFAVSNGYLSSSAFINSPKYFEGHEAEEVAGVVQSFSMSLGSIIGSIAGFGVRGIVCKCNPFTS